MADDSSNPWDDDADDTGVVDETAGSSTHTSTDDADLDEGDGPRFEIPAGQGGQDAPDALDDDDEETDDRRRIIIIAAVAFVLIAAIGFFLTSGGDDDTEAGGSSTTQEGGGANNGPTGGSVTIAGTRDPFDRPDTENGLGTMPGGAEWVTETGTWAIKGGQATTTVPASDDDQDRRNIIVVGTGYPNANEEGGPQAQVRLATLASNAGLVFRYKNTCNYWVVYAVETYAVWNVERVVDCKKVPGPDSEGEDDKTFAKIKEAPVADGTLVGVVLDGDQIQIVLNGKVVGTYTDDTHAGAGKVGLTTLGKDSGTVRFDDFVAGGPGGKGVISGGGGQGGQGGQGGGEGESEDAPADEQPDTTEG